MKWFLSLLILFSSSAYCRNLNFNESMISTYLRGGMGLINAQKFAWQPGFPATVFFPETLGSNYNYDVEVGFGYQSPKMCFRLGAEVLYPVAVMNTQGVNSGGISWMTITSEIYSIIPKVSLEFAIKQSPNFRFFIGGAGGYAITTLKNTVTMTAAGTAALGGLNSYIEEGTGYGISGEAFTGIEFAFFDNVGFSVDVGYRYLLNPSFNANRSATTANGSLAVGQTITNNGGGNRNVNLSGYYSNATFRIYIR